MNPQVRNHLNNAIKIVEGFRYVMGVNRFIEYTINCWSFHQSGVFPPVLGDDWSEEANQGAISVSMELSAAMMIDPVSDVLGWFLSETGYYNTTASFYPTPPEVAKLVSSLLGNSSDTRSGKYDHYECCVGTGILTLSYLDDLLEREGAEFLKKVKLTMEDMNPLIVKCCLLQLLHYLDARSVQINSFRLETIDSLTRIKSNPCYFAFSQSSRTQDVVERKKEALTC